MLSSHQKLQSNYTRPWFLIGSDFDKILAPLFETKESPCPQIVDSDEETEENSSGEGESDNMSVDYEESSESDGVVFDDACSPAEEVNVDNQADKPKDAIKHTLKEVFAIREKDANKSTIDLTKELCEKKCLENYPKLWPIENADIMIELGNAFKELEKPIIAYSFYRCAIKSHPEHSAVKKHHDDILQTIDDLDNVQLKSVCELREKLCDAISKHQSDSPTSFDWANAIKNAYPNHVYNTCAIEGNHLSLSEVKTLIQNGSLFRDSSNKDDVRDDAEVIGAHKAFQYLFSELDGEKHITIEHMCDMHRLLMKGTPKEKTAGEFDNEEGISKDDITKHMESLMKWLLEELQRGIIDGVSLSVMAHYHLVLLHPFNDGNGRSSRNLMNYVLMRCNFPPVIIPESKKHYYYDVLDLAHRGDIRPFVRFVTNCLSDSIKELLQAVTPHRSNGTYETGNSPSRSVVSRSKAESFSTLDKRNFSAPDVNWFNVYANIICNSDNFV
ncbi:fic/DOC family domain-containing protein [Ditylenchus destructor]|nr:fic/DOC family domain-containing protein [Ditylenchus destructor]